MTNGADASADPNGDDERTERAAEYEAMADALEDLVVELRDEPIKESRLEGLFDEATTSDPRIWNTVTAFIDVEDGEAVVTDESKLAQGSWAPEIVEGCDTMVTVDVQRGLMPDDFTYAVGKKLSQRIEEFRAKAAEARADDETDSNN
ncbi:hypothetical protein [Natrialba asiatica]|uniref:Uncharacterized protein n=1 Tax=Natrialba asiatica (strain ATCC 700177 / DSM 12278 / JCM 9576 / FERM P-10747 / NBRC 102637 / 172P1) TaxID=29540 RepID=M0B3S9_NATA1|nr:hypothetical protein [Natrialba asiatica]ELZ04898.1 hypothetical protein C481_03927 [Natrialba asiatica DSM 12278]